MLSRMTKLTLTNGTRAALGCLVLVLPASEAGSREVVAQCLIRPAQVIQLGAPVSGIITTTHVDRGVQVRAGQALVTLDTAAQDIALRAAEARASNRAKVDAAQGRADLLEAQLERQRALAARNIVSASVVQETETAWLIARNDVEIAQREMDLAVIDVELAVAERARRTVTSPIDGIVIARALSVGEYWAEGAAFATIADTRTLHVDAVVDKSDFGKVLEGAFAAVIPEAPIGGSFTARVEVIDPVFDAASGTFGVRLVLDNADLRLPAGLRCEVIF